MASAVKREIFKSRNGLRDNIVEHYSQNTITLSDNHARKTIDQKKLFLDTHNFLFLSNQPKKGER